MRIRTSPGPQSRHVVVWTVPPEMALPLFPFVEPAAPRLEPDFSLGFRPLLPDVGVERLARLGDFRSLISAQLAHPERLRDSHRLACRVRAFEITLAQSQQAFVASLGLDASGPLPFAPLTPEAAERLDLRLAPDAPALSAARRPGELLPQDRILQLEVMEDPTRETPVDPPAARTTIPERFARSWEFLQSREEALYDMEQEAPFGLWRRLRERTTARGAFRKWTRLREGRTLDEQLWSVAPPRGFLASPTVRGWARACLEQAGYDSRVMLPEWELFWRRKGR